jgi:hypothetical protein
MPAQSAARFFRSAHTVFASFYGVLLPLAVLMLLAGYAVLLWVAVVREIDPITSQRVVSVEPENRHLDRSTVQDITITREICSRRAQQVDVLLAWTEARPEGQPRPIVAFTRFLRDLEKGCHPIVVTQPVPHSLESGKYIYTVSSRACSPLNRCVERELEAIPFTVASGLGASRR